VTVDERFMAQAIAEAEKALGRTHPNPAVGAVIVKAGKVIARGHHVKAGAPHAEVVALSKAGVKARGATLYTTLEPCNHHGRTPPCSEAILKAGIGRVVFASSDPNPLVDGRGVKRLRKGGVEVAAHVLRAEADALNRPFFKAMRTGLPWVTLKVAVTLDGKLAAKGGDSKWVTGEAAREKVHALRGLADAILVGAGTVRRDDPQLTARLKGTRNPVRVVLGDVPKKARVLDDQARTIVFAQKTPLKQVLKQLVAEGLLHVLVEGGSVVHSEFLKQGLFDEVLVFVAPKLVGAEGVTWSGALGVTKMAQAVPLALRSVWRVGDDVLFELAKA
jgi:diaminohydroxyphosphoribosylaminopyrimidine deaminase/5-amino-6-(5-phosphoribosylamino)uracil reductase